MATIYTHALVGLGLGKVFTRRRVSPLFWILAGFLPVLPDFDSFSFSAYGSLWGHRGFTHSLCFALALALLTAGLTFRFLHMKFWLLFGLFFLITASHGLLDAFTNGGFGIPLFWPFWDHRFGPYGPIHVQDIGFEFPDPPGKSGRPHGAPLRVAADCRGRWGDLDVSPLETRPP